MVVETISSISHGTDDQIVATWHTFCFHCRTSSIIHSANPTERPNEHALTDFPTAADHAKAGRANSRVSLKTRLFKALILGLAGRCRTKEAADTLPSTSARRCIPIFVFKPPDTRRSHPAPLTGRGGCRGKQRCRRPLHVEYDAATQASAKPWPCRVGQSCRRTDETACMVHKTKWEVEVDKAI